MTFISTETKRKRDEKVSEGQKRSGRERNPEKLVTVYTACKLQHCQASANELSATLHSEGISKAVSLFRKPTLDNSKKKICFKCGSGKADTSPLFISGHFSMIPALSCLLSVKWLKLMLFNRLGRGTQKPGSTSGTTWAPRRLNKAQKNILLLRWNGLGTQH